MPTPPNSWIPPSTRARRIHTPTVLQMEAVECGAASLSIVLSYFGRIVALEELRPACGVTRDGSRANDVVRAARQYGLVAKGYRKEPADLLGMPLPLIAFWNFNHFLVIEGFCKQGVYLNDPATGPRLVSAEEFDQSFTGLVISVQPGPEFEKGGEKNNLWRSLGWRFKASQIGIVYAVLASLGLVIPGLVIPALARLFVDDFLVQGQRDWLGLVFAGLALTTVLRAAFTWLQQYALLRLETRLALSNSSHFFWHLLRLPLRFYFQRSPAEVGSRVVTNDRIARLLSGDLATALLDILMAIFYAGWMLYYSPPLTLVGLSISAINFAVLYLVSRQRVDTNQSLLQDNSKFFTVAMTGLLMIENLKASGTENDFFARWAGHQAKVLNAEQKLGVSTQLLAVVPAFLSILSTASVLILGSMLVMQGEISLGVLVAFQSLLTSFTDPLNRLVGLGGTLQEVTGDMYFLDDVLRSPTDPSIEAAVGSTAPGDEEPFTRLTGQLEVRDLTFGYNRFEPPLIENFNLKLKPGDRVALVGGSGSGKSTIARLIAGLYQPWSGEILLDGRKRDEIPRAVITHSIAMVDQDLFLFEGSIRENLTLWDDTTPTTVMIQAARDACIHEEIAVRAKGYDSEVHEEGRNFSGGQRQRLEIARALTGQPTLLIMDEATSALDAITEKQIDDQLRRRGCTCLIVAHRLSTIRDCDEIIVLENGHIVQRGAHKELEKAGGLYARLVQADVVAPKKSRIRSLLESLE